MVLFLGRTSNEVFVVLVVHSFCSSFCCCCSSFISSYVMLFFIHCFSKSSLTLPWTIDRFLVHPFYTFSPAHCRVIHSTFILTFSRSSSTVFTASDTVLSGRFSPYAPSPTFYLRLLRPPWEPAVLPWSLQGFMLILETQTDPSACLIHSNSQSSYSELISKFYQTLSWITCGESLIYLLLTCFELFSLIPSHM